MVDPGRFLELSPDLFVALWQGLPIALNHAWTDTLGWELDELTCDQLRDLIHPDDLAGSACPSPSASGSPPGAPAVSPARTR